MPSKQLPLRLFLAALAVMAGLVFLPAAASADAVSMSAARQINAYRVAHGAPALAIDGRLAHAARSQSAAMMARRSLAHGPTGSGKTRLTRICLRMHAKTIGETIGWVRISSPAAQARSIVRRWMTSPPHRAALMSTTFSRIGVGRRIGRFRGHRVVWFTADLTG